MEVTETSTQRGMNKKGKNVPSLLIRQEKLQMKVGSVSLSFGIKSEHRRLLGYFFINSFIQL